MKKIIILVAWWSCVTIATLLLFSGSILCVPFLAVICAVPRVLPRAHRMIWVTSYRACMRMFVCN